MWEYGVLTLKEKRAESCRYHKIIGKFRLHEDYIEAVGVSDTHLKVDAIIPTTTILKIEFD